MGRLRDLGWAIRDRAGGIALVLALLACGAGAAGIVIALDARDKAEEAGELAAQSTVPTAPAGGDVEATVDELNERVAAIEESVSSLREELATGTTTTEETTTTTEDSETPPPEVPELPEGVELPGVGEPESEAPAP
jgi:hypothetical protein